MAQCEEGYRCEVCGGDVEDITQSDLYLRYVLGEVDPEVLHLSPERHLRCNPTLAQFIVDEAFDSVRVMGPFAKAGLDAAWVAEEEARVSRGFRRLRELFLAVEPVSLTDYPLAGVAEKWTHAKGGA